MYLTRRLTFGGKKKQDVLVQVPIKITLKSDKKQASILMLQDDVKIMGWTNQLVTLLLPNKHGRYQDMDKLYQIGSRKFAMDAKDLKIAHVLKNVHQTHKAFGLGRSLSCMSSILC